MIDLFKAEASIYVYPNKEDCFSMSDLEFKPSYSTKGLFIGHIASFQNLNIKIFGGKIIISNSLHKFYHGNNYSDFSHSEIVNAIEVIENKFGISSDKFKLKHLEFGINIQSEYDVWQEMTMYISTGFDFMKHHKRKYGKKCILTEYNLKVYDKTFVAKLDYNSYYNAPNNIKRFEIQYKKMRCIKKIATHLSDLKNKEVLENLSIQFLNCFKKVITFPNYNYHSLSPRRRELVFAGQNPKFWDIERDINKNTYKSKRAQFNKTVNFLNDKLEINHYRDILKKLTNKINHLINN